MAWHGALAGALAAAACGVVHAGGLRLQPVVVTLAPGETSAVVSIDNDGMAPLEVRARVFDWTQREGEDELSPTREVGISPARARIPPGRHQRLRMLVITPPPDDRERSYRIILDEAGDDASAAPTRYSLPLFVNADGRAPVRLTARLVPLGPTATRLRIDNPDRHHAKLVDLSFRPADGGAVRSLAPDLAGYVLPGRHKHWTLPAPIEQFREGRFEAIVNGRPVVLAPDLRDPD